MTQPLVLSLFPGIGLLDMAFELEGFCVVRGPDLLWGRDIRDFHASAGHFDGVIGGPPCQLFSQMRHMNPRVGQKQGNMIPEYERVVSEAQPDWFVMENVSDAPEPTVPGYRVRSLMLRDDWVGGETRRLRRFSFGSRAGVALAVEQMALHVVDPGPAVTGGSRLIPVAIGGNGKVKRTKIEGVSRVGPGRGQRMTIGDMLAMQGAPATLLDDTAYTESAKRQMIGNGVPLPMGRAVARAVRAAMYPVTAEGAA
jgi:DNA (cytosine-5)-methyltransferase 1